LALFGSIGSGSAQFTHLDYLETDLDYNDALLAALILAVGRGAHLSFAADEAVCGAAGVGYSHIVEVAVAWIAQFGAFALAAVSLFTTAPDSLADNGRFLDISRVAGAQNTAVLAGTMAGFRPPSRQTTPPLGI
jgi:hypothetical protein